MKNYLYVLFLLGVAACNQSAKNEGDKSSTDIKSDTGDFDLSELSLSENLITLMAAHAVKSEPIGATDNTVFGYELFNTSSPKILRFAKTDFTKVAGRNKNRVLFHYNEQTKMLAGYELQLYDQVQTDQLIKLIGAIAKPTFKQTEPSKGGIELDENGDEITPEKRRRATFRVWEDHNKGLSYFLTESGTGKDLEARLTVLKGKTKFGQDMITLKLFNWYKNAESEPL